MLNKTHLIQHLMEQTMMQNSQHITYIEHFDAIKGNIVINPVRITSPLLKKQLKTHQAIWLKYGKQSLLEQFLDLSQFTVYETEIMTKRNTKSYLKQLQEAGIDYVFCVDITQLKYTQNHLSSLLWGILDSDTKNYLAAEIHLNIIDTHTYKTVYQANGTHSTIVSPAEINHLAQTTEGTIMNLMEMATQNAMRNLIRGWAYLIQ